jgi:ABC-type antimicrobial peptide transport system permease subunit
MLVGVAERTREIGLRKAVGASNANIVWQFLIEALIMSLFGGILGYLGGYLIAFVISTALPFDPIFSWQIAAFSLGVAVIVGGIFGLYPAIRAAQKDPIESLRQYH